MFDPPFIVLLMPLDYQGRGPASEEDTVKTIWQVWDAAWRTVSSHDTEAEAIDAARLAEKEYGP